LNEYLSKVIYNKKLKERFLKQYPEKTQKFYRYVFSKSFDTEDQLKQDLCKFNNDQLIKCIKSFNNASVQSVYSVISIIRQYLAFCSKEGLITTNINYLDSIGGYKDIKSFLDVQAHQNKYINVMQLHDICDLCLNSQDAIIPALLFEGVKGEQCHEIVNLKIQDCDFLTNQITLTSHTNTKRTITATNFTMELILDAYNEKQYVKNNGEVGECIMSSPIYKIEPNEYILRISARSEQGAINPCNIIARINRIKTYYGNPYLTATNLWISGMIHENIKILNEKYKEKEVNLDTIKKLTKDDYLMVNKKFGFPNVYWYKIKEKVKTCLSMKKDL
jgi:site-specific recombinase XerD